MDEKEIRETDIWTLYNKNVDYARVHGFFQDVDKCNNFYNGDQWENLILEGSFRGSGCSTRAAFAEISSNACYGRSRIGWFGRRC